MTLYHCNMPSLADSWESSQGTPTVHNTKKAEDPCHAICMQGPALYKMEPWCMGLYTALQPLYSSG